MVRPNRRLGNVLFLTPMLQSLADALPEAVIDVFIRDAAQRPLLETLPGVGRVWVMPPTLFGAWRFCRRLRSRHYDLVIDPIDDSTSNRLTVALSGARQRLGFAGPRQWVRLTHAASPETVSRHPALQAVELLNGAVDGLAFEPFPALKVKPSAAAFASARGHWASACGDRREGRPIIGFFMQATGWKRYSDEWWQRWRSAMNERLPQALLVQIRAPDEETGLDPAIPSVAIAALDELAAFLAGLDVFVAADSGPMHLAAAAGTRVVGLFRATSPEYYAPLGAHCTSLSGADLEGDEAAHAVCALLGNL